jgi:hypothetical protein
LGSGANYKKGSIRSKTKLNKFQQNQFRRKAILSQENSTEESVVILIKENQTYRCHQTRN